MRNVIPTLVACVLAGFLVGGMATLFVAEAQEPDISLQPVCVRHYTGAGMEAVSYEWRGVQTLDGNTTAICSQAAGECVSGSWRLSYGRCE